MAGKSSARRVLIDNPPFWETSLPLNQRGKWPAWWVRHPSSRGVVPVVTAYRRRFTLERSRTIRVHVSADERYELFLDGNRIGRGPERGDRENWFFETYDLDLSAGVHVIVARSWRLGDMAPHAQVSVEHGFVLCADAPAGHDDHALLSTGVARWDAMLIRGIEHTPKGVTWGTGTRVAVDGHLYPFGWHEGDEAAGARTDDVWTPVETVDVAISPLHLLDQPPRWILRQAVLPPMHEVPIHVGTTRFVETLEAMPPRDPTHALPPIDMARNRVDETRHWDGLVAGRGVITIPPRTVRRVIIDLKNYYCGYPQLVTSGGRGAEVRVFWAESLFVADDKGRPTPEKACRDDVAGRVFVGNGDCFLPDGDIARHFTTLWWEAGRYLQILVATQDEALTIESLYQRETHYPFDWKATFTSDDPRLAQLTPAALRTLEMCAHETYMDCPYYEQLQYVGDTRLEVLTSYVTAPDSRLARKAVELFGRSVKPTLMMGQSRYPARVQQVIPTFCLWWIAMLHDRMMWRADKPLVHGLLPIARLTLDAMDQHRNSDGLIAAPPGWNYMDWVPVWVWGMPRGADDGVSALLQLQYALSARMAADIEDHCGYAETASLHRRRARQAAAATLAAFWDESRGLIADDTARTSHSEHAQCLALLCDAFEPADPRRERVIDRLLNDPGLHRTTIYYTHYLFETYRLLGRIDRLLDRMKLWFDLPALGLFTTPEQPEPSRSDCHAWGAHPLFHYHATILGIRPGAAGFGSVIAQPQLGPLKSVAGETVHPAGIIRSEWARQGDRLTGTIELPPNVPGTLIINGEHRIIDGGRLHIT